MQEGLCEGGIGGWKVRERGWNIKESKAWTRLIAPE